MCGYTTGKKDDPQIQTLYVECKSVTASSDSKLVIDYESFNGILDDYDPQANRVTGTLELELDGSEKVEMFMDITDIQKASKSENAA